MRGTDARDGAGSSAPSTTGSPNSSAGTWRSSAIAGQPWSRSAKACAMPSTTSGRTSPGWLALRCDWGPQYIADAWINEVKWLGIAISPSYVGEPECNGVIERFMRTLKEQCLYLHRFPDAGGSAGDHRPVHRAPKRRVADRAPWLSDAGPGAHRGLEGRRVRIRPSRPPMPRAVAPPRSAFDEGRRYLRIPRNEAFSGLTIVQGTGCGTLPPRAPEDR
jgi:hypothetical protein